jgi:C-terminal processing protease CtpA/Prc
VKFNSILCAASLLTLPSCTLFGSSAPEESPPLFDMQEPSALLAEPDDEARRLELEAGSFSGLAVEDARDSLASLTQAPEGVLVTRVVENSPAAAAGLEYGDRVLEVDAGFGPVALSWPSEWRAIELAQPAGTILDIVYERRGAESRCELVLVERLRPAPRGPVLRYREEERVGIVLRTATEVEARAAGLAPGAGALVTGLSMRSPWRAAGVEAGDLVVALDGQTVAHPDVVLDAILEADEDARLKLSLRRGGESLERVVRVSRRNQDLQSVSLPLLLSYVRERDRCEFSLVLGLIRFTLTRAAWRMRLLCLFSFGAGDSDRLIEVDV